MSVIGIPPEIRTLALDLANLGRLAETTCASFSTDARFAQVTDRAAAERAAAISRAGAVVGA